MTQVYLIRHLVSTLNKNWTGNIDEIGTTNIKGLDKAKINILHFNPNHKKVIIIPGTFYFRISGWILVYFNENRKILSKIVL